MTEFERSTTASPPAPAGAADWWQHAVVYQVYPRSFADSDGDGVGDLPGVTSRVPYLQALGVDAIWLSPFYPSPLADGGYDIADYRAVAPELGTLNDFDALVAAAHAASLKVLVDIVPNHTSNQHPWFQAALAAGPGSAARDRYVFHTGTGPDGQQPPSDWVSEFGGSAWTRTTDPDGQPGQWYLHLFAPEQPDLNWANLDVQADFEATLRFWADRGVDGFRIDVAIGLAKDLTEPLRSTPARLTRESMPDDGSHPFYDRDAVHDIYRAWRRVFNEYDPPRMAVAEAYSTPERLALYTRPDELSQVFNFDLLLAEFDPHRFHQAITTALDQATRAGTSPTWVLSNHDIVRHSTRYGLPAGTDLDAWLLDHDHDDRLDAARGLRRARAATMLILALPGSTYLYQGEELGLPEAADIPGERLQDPVWTRSGHIRRGRDGSRVPLPWQPDKPAYGFNTTGTTWLPQPDTFRALAASVQDGDPASTLELYRAALSIRRGHASSPDATVDSDPGVLHIARPDGWHSYTNFGADPRSLPAGDLLLVSTGTSVPIQQLEGETTVWLQRP